MGKYFLVAIFTFSWPAMVVENRSLWIPRPLDPIMVTHKFLEELVIKCPEKLPMAEIVPKNIDLKKPLLELIRLTSVDLRSKVQGLIQAARGREEEGSAAQNALDVILENIEISRRESSPICQDTGTPLFFVNHPLGWSTRQMDEEIRWAAAEATRRAYLRPNAVCPITGKNTGDNTGTRYPYTHYHEWERDEVEFNLLLKGGGSENCGRQYTLPDSELGAGRDLAGIKKCVVDAVYRAQGFGCAPGILGIGVGGDRGSSFEESKLQLLRPLDDAHPDPQLAEVERELYEKTNALKIGPMGFGGKTTILAVKMGIRHRVPASFFVSVSYLCWAARARRMTVKNGEVTYD